MLDGVTCKQGTLQRKSKGFDLQVSPNIVYIHSHDSGRYLSPYGESVPTPNLQRLGKEGIVFRKAFSAAPTCSPSRAALLTGQCSHSSGMLGLAHRGFSLNDYQQHIVHTLKPAGYTSVLAGLQHVAKEPGAIGYDIVLPHQDTSAVHVAPAAVGFLDSRPTSPFFLDIGFFETHREYPEATPEDKANYAPLPRPIPDTAATRGDFAATGPAPESWTKAWGRFSKPLIETVIAKTR